MKLISISITVFLFFSVPVFSELTVEDLEKIRTIVNESEDRMKEYVKASETRMKEYVEASETRIKEYVDIKIQGINDTVDIKIQGINDTVDEMDKRLSLIANLVIALVALVILAVGVPQIIMTWRDRREKAQTERIEKLEEQIGIIAAQLSAGGHRDRE